MTTIDKLLAHYQNSEPDPALAEAREIYRRLGETIADIAELQPHQREPYIERFVMKMMIELGEHLVSACELKL